MGGNPEETRCKLAKLCSQWNHRRHAQLPRKESERARETAHQRLRAQGFIRAAKGAASVSSAPARRPGSQKAGRHVALTTVFAQLSFSQPRRSERAAGTLLKPKF